jgi:hypothetical protein
VQKQIALQKLIESPEMNSLMYDFFRREGVKGKMSSGNVGDQRHDGPRNWAQFGGTMAAPRPPASKPAF